MEILSPNTDLDGKEILCTRHGHYRIVLCCVACKKFPCKQLIVEGYLPALNNSEFLNHEFLGFESKRSKMYILKLKDGSLVQADSNFDIDNPPTDLLQDIVEVYVVSKVLQKQVKLTLKSADERKQIRRRKRKDESSS